MRLIMRVVTFALVAIGSAVLFAQGVGSVHGTVIDEQGHPVAGAQVRCDPMDGRPAARALLIVETDKSGHFSVENLGLGGYKLFAMKEASGYPNTAFGFYGDVFPTVTLTASVPIADITLKVGPPAGVMSGSVTEDSISAPVPARFLLRRISDPDNFISMSQRAEYRVLVPPSVEVSVEVSAPGYKTWYYGGPSDMLQRPPILLKSGKEMKLDIQLEPKDRPSILMFVLRGHDSKAPCACAASVLLGWPPFGRFAACFRPFGFNRTYEKGNNKRSLLVHG